MCEFECSDTVSRSAVFCAIATTIERCKTEGVVDVFQVVKAIRIHRPGAIRTVVRKILLTYKYFRQQSRRLYLNFSFAGTVQASI